MHLMRGEPDITLLHELDTDGKERNAMNEARLSHLPFWGPSEAVLFLIKRPSG